ncbi:chemotaxis protein [Hoeflea sp.]|uniref:chemotaxis protein n=1 Tax=Hoeflea sp. TaxID=1940281 RepID=UPI003B517550
MPDRRRLKTASLAALAAVFAFTASAEEPPAPGATADDGFQAQQDPGAAPADAGSAPVFDPTVGYPPLAESPVEEPVTQSHGASNGEAEPHGAGAQDAPASTAEAPGGAHTEAGGESVAEHGAEPAVPESDAGSAVDGTQAQAGPETSTPVVEGVRADDFAMTEDVEGLEPYKLIRSLQVVQDSVVSGDHSAMAMQRFLLETIDSRLRSADERVFDDPRNVDAALIYAMSGGNPETLEILALKDKFGNFDNEITTVLRAYLNGRAAKTQEEMAEVVEIYRDTPVGPYLTLVAANVTAALNDASALELFDWARLTAPGTLVEEAALRRSLFIAERNDMVDEAISYAQLYARRFINSPYAGQYADLLVDLVVQNYEKVGEDRLNAILSFMDRPRKREVYLRIARKAVITGLRDLALLASEKAEEFVMPGDEIPKTLAGLYSGMAKVPTDGVNAVLDTLNAVPERKLTARDRALREAARTVAAEVIRKPDPASLTQAIRPMLIEPRPETGTEVADPEAAGDEPAQTADLAAAAAKNEEAEAAARAFEGYVSDRRKTLDRIDEMLKGVEEEQGS